MGRTIDIRTPSGRLIGRIEVDSNGNKTVRDSVGRLLGRYEAHRDAVTDAVGRIVVWGDAPGILLNEHA